MKTGFAKKMIAVVMAVLMLMPIAAVGASGASLVKITMRIEGIEKTIVYDSVLMESDTSANVRTAIETYDKKLATLSVTFDDVEGSETFGSIKTINNISNGDYLAADGTTPEGMWHVTIEKADETIGSNPDYSDLSKVEVTSGEQIVIYYGTIDCQYPVINTQKAGTTGVLNFTDAHGAPIEKATITWGYDSKNYSADTDANGDLQLRNGQYDVGTHSVQITKTDTFKTAKDATKSAKLYTVCPFAEDFVIEIEESFFIKLVKYFTSAALIFYKMFSWLFELFGAQK